MMFLSLDYFNDIDPALVVIGSKFVITRTEEYKWSAVY